MANFKNRRITAIIYVDGKYMKVAPQVLDAFTPGKNVYHGVFETMHVIDGSIEYVEEHLRRLQAGLKTLKIKSTYSSAQFKRIANKVVIKNPKMPHGRLRFMVFNEGGKAHTICMILPYKPYSLAQYKKGLRATIIKTRRNTNARLAQVKSLDYAMFAQAYAQVKAQGFDEAILLNQKGDVCETSRGNIFILHKGQWLTPPLSSGCLNGIVRQRLLVQLKKAGIKVYEKRVTPAILKAATRIFMTNSMVGMIQIIF